MNRCLRGAMALVLIVSATFAAPVPSTAQVDGNSYVSPNFGYRLSWDASWWVDDEDAIDGVDYLGLTNGITYLGISGTDFFAGRTRPCVRNARSFLVAQDANSNIEVLLDPNGQPIESYQDDHSVLALAFTHTLEDGSIFDLVTYIACRTVVPGDTVVQFAATGLLDTFFSEQPAVEALIAGLVIPSSGEIGPVFASGPWRVSVVATHRGRAVPDLGLTEKDGKQWLVVATDVTNWSSQDNVFRTGDLLAAHVDGSKPARLAPASTAKAARALGSEPADPEAGVAFGADQTTRVVLVFQVSASLSEPALVVDDQLLPLDTTTAGSGADLTELPGVVTPLLLTEVTVEDVLDGNHIVVSDAAGTAREIALFGVEAPVNKECYANQAAARLTSLAGDAVWIEPALPNDETNGVYLWRVRGDGSRTLINQELVAGGFGAVTGPEGRYTAWLEATERDAQAKPAGIWSACSDVPGRDLPNPDTTASRTPAA